MTKLNWTHYKTRVARALEAALELVPPGEAAPAEMVLESIMRTDGFPVDGEAEIPEVAEYYRMLVALEADGVIEIHPQRGLDGVIPGWGLTFPAPAEEKPDWQRVLIGLAPALLTYLATTASKPSVVPSEPLPDKIPTPWGTRHRCPCGGYHKEAPASVYGRDPTTSDIESWIRGERRPAGTSDDFLKTLLDIASGSPGLSAMKLTKEDQEALATGDLKDAATWHKLSPRLREFLLAAGLSAPEGYMAPAPATDAPPTPASASEPQPGAEPKEPV